MKRYTEAKCSEIVNGHTCGKPAKNHGTELYRKGLLGTSIGMVSHTFRMAEGIKPDKSESDAN